jgi:heat shock protein HslJ
MIKSLVTTAMAAWLLLGCATNKAPEVVTAANQQRLHQHWELTGMTLDSRPVIMHVDARITLSFSPDGQVAGFAAVNRFAGRYQISADGKLVWSSPGFSGTRMGGPPELMEKERTYLDALRRTSVAIASATALVLQTTDGSTTLSFSSLGR